MRMYSLLLVLAGVMFAGSAAAAQPPDPVLLNGLRSWMANGLDAGLRTWYTDRPELALQMAQQIEPTIKGLGGVIDTEVVALQTISKRVTRYYVAVYFTAGPLWLRIERYASDKGATYVPLRFSTEADRILPGYLTEFQL